ncbi:BlaI/MecI/CopY family transcriptional regulator [Aliidiomarina sp.]|uniref:BlaI/MecI/CopY family transcriptional regulator n=1 Tax=Aliidiomarina sp. TaxID=1872439 RepID=UPI003A4E06E9
MRLTRSYLYSPAISEKAYQEKASKSFVQRLFSGNVTPLVAHFAEKGELSDKDIAELKAFIEKLEDRQHDYLMLYNCFCCIYSYFFLRSRR